MSYDIVSGSMEYLDRSMPKCVSSNKAKSCSLGEGKLVDAYFNFKSQYDSFIGNEDTIFLKQQSFKGK